MTLKIPSFEDRKSDYLEQRREEVTRAAHLSPNVTAVSFLGMGNVLSFIYDPLKVRVRGYAGKITESVGCIEESSIVPGIIDFKDALIHSKLKFTSFTDEDIGVYAIPEEDSGWYVVPDVTRETRYLAEGHRLKERDKLYGVLVLNPEGILPQFRQR